MSLYCLGIINTGRGEIRTVNICFAKKEKTFKSLALFPASPFYALLLRPVLDIHESYMHRCLQLARLGAGRVAPNPMVGAVLVYQDRVIGEGYHRQWGGPHAEVACLASVQPEDEGLMAQSVLYVSLEPCAHFGKTPPCADLIIRMRIPKVIIGCRDPFAAVNGKGIEKLEAAGIEVIAGLLEKECLELNKRFFTFHTKQRPYIILKWAQTSDRKIARYNDQRLLITDEYTNRIVHKWRSEESAILVGTRTAGADDPALTTRLWPGLNPVRLVIDTGLKLPAGLKLFNNEAPTIIFNYHRHSFDEGPALGANVKAGGLFYYQLHPSKPLIQELLSALYQLNLLSVIVEGGAATLQSFIDMGCWDEARVLTNESLLIGEGLPAPVLENCELTATETVFSDTIRTYRPVFGEKDIST